MENNRLPPLMQDDLRGEGWNQPLHPKVLKPDPRLYEIYKAYGNFLDNTTGQHNPVRSKRLSLLVFVSALLMISIQALGALDPADAFAQEQDEESAPPVLPPVRSPIQDSSLALELEWQPEEAGIGHETIFLARFLDNETGRPLATPSIVTYDLEIFSHEGSLIGGFYGQETENDGIGRPLIVEFEEGGPVSITVYVHSVVDLSSGDRIPVDKTVTIGIIVVPEFSVYAVAVLSGVMGTMILIGRLRFRTRILH